MIAETPSPDRKYEGPQSAADEGVSEQLYNELVTKSTEQAPAVDKKRIWLPKCICIVSENPYYDFYGQVLIDLWASLFVDPLHIEALKKTGSGDRDVRARWS